MRIILYKSGYFYLTDLHSTVPVISPFWMVKGMTKSKGLSPATSSPFIPSCLSVACEEGEGNQTDQN